MLASSAWDSVHRRLRAAPALYPLGPGQAGCGVCRGPVRPGFARCYQCGRHDRLGRGLLAGTVVPVSYAIKGTTFAADLWRYKSWSCRNATSRASISVRARTSAADLWRYKSWSAANVVPLIA